MSVIITKALGITLGAIIGQSICKFIWDRQDRKKAAHLRALGKSNQP